MDANGTRYHLLLGREDWASCKEEVSGSSVDLGRRWADRSGGTGWDAQRNEITLRPLLFQFEAGSGDRAPSIEDRRGAAVDRFGNVYFIDASGRGLSVRSAGSGRTSAFWPPAEPPSPRALGLRGEFHRADPDQRVLRGRLAGLAVTAHHYLVVGTLDPGGLLVFDLFAGGPPRALAAPDGVRLSPWDLAAAPDGGVVVLDRAHQRFWSIDPRFAARGRSAMILDPARPAMFQPADAAAPIAPLPATTFPDAIWLAASSPLPAIDPVAIDVRADGTVLVLDRTPGAPFSTILWCGPEGVKTLRFRGGSDLGVVASILDPESRAAFTLVGHDLAVEGDLVHVVSSTGNQSFALATQIAEDGALELWPLAEYRPLRLFGGRGLFIASAAPGVPAEEAGPYYDSGSSWVPLVAQQRPRFVDRAEIVTRVLDGRVPDCVWHRLLIDAVLPDGADLFVQSRAADDETSLRAARWIDEPHPLHRRRDGSELPFAPRRDRPGEGTFELLFQRARGRYAELKLVLIGNGVATPRLFALRAYYPRTSYVARFLPAVYRDNDTFGFLERFLANVEGFHTSIEDRIAAAQILFDVRGAPREALDWLASWLGAALDPSWEDARRRLFLRHAMDLFRARGTRRGLTMAIQLATSPCPDPRIFTRDEDTMPDGVRIIERFATRRAPGVVFGDPSDPSAVIAPDPSKQWTPARGGAALLAAYWAVDPAASFFPLQPPDDVDRAAAWRDFSRSVIGFVPRVSPLDDDAYRAFLARRYHRVSALAAAYGADVKSFAEASAPTLLPADNDPLRDWYDFETVVLAARATAGRFTVMLPVRKGEAADDEAQRARRAQVERVVEIARPAHTTFEVKLYWAMLRVGDARLGIDTRLDQSSRVPELMPKMVLGRAHLLEGHLHPSPPEDAGDRVILGRDGLGDRPI